MFAKIRIISLCAKNTYIFFDAMASILSADGGNVVAPRLKTGTKKKVVSRQPILINLKSNTMKNTMQN